MDDQNRTFFVEQIKYVRFVGYLHLLRFALFSRLLISIIPFLYSFAIFGNPLVIITLIFSSIELLSGVFILLKKKIALILYLPLLTIYLYSAVFSVVYIFDLANTWTLPDIEALVFACSLIIEGIICVYLGISFLRSKWAYNEYETHSTD